MMELDTLHRRTGTLCAVLAATCLIGQTMAAPATSQELSGTTETTGSADIAGSRRAAPNTPTVVTGVPQSRTVELLLQMQDKPDIAGGDAGAKGTGGDPARRNGSSTSPVSGTKKTGDASAVAEPNPLANLKSAVMGPGVQQESAGPESREAPRSAAMDSQATLSSGGAATASRDDGQPRESLLSNPVVRFIRENRSLTIGASLVVLLGLWATATFSMRRGR